MLPQFQGARLIYHKVLQPLLKRHQKTIEQLIKDVSGTSVELFKEGMSTVKDQARKQMNDPDVQRKLIQGAQEAQKFAEKVETDQ